MKLKHISLENKAIVDITLRPQYCRLVSHFEYTQYLRRLCLADYGQILRRPQNRKYITYYTVVREGPSHSHTTCVENFVKFGHVVFEIYFKH